MHCRQCVSYEVITCALDASDRSHMICTRLSGIYLSECTLVKLVFICIDGITMPEKDLFVHLVWS